MFSLQEVVLKKNILYIPALLVLLCCAKAEMQYKSGLTYTSLIQSYYPDYEEDTLTVSNEYKTFVDAKYISGKRRVKDQINLSFGSRTANLRNKFQYTPKTRFFDLDINDQFEYRYPWDEESSLKSYLKNALNLKVKRAFGSNITFVNEFKHEKKHHPDSDDKIYNYDFIRYSGYFYLYKDFFTRYQYSERFLPDSTEGEYSENTYTFTYDRYSFELDASYLSFMATKRDYRMDEKSYNKYSLISKKQLQLTSSFALVPKYEFELYRYETQSLSRIDYDHHYATLSLLYRHGLEIEGEFGVSYMKALPDTAVAGEVFDEISMPFVFNYYKLRKFWVNLTFEPGWRRYDKIDDDYDEYDFSFYSNYFFSDVGLVFSYWINESYKINLIGSYSPEWHKVSEDDYSLTYISINLNYQFK